MLSCRAQAAYSTDEIGSSMGKADVCEPSFVMLSENR